MQSTDFKWKAPTSKASALNGKCLDGSDEQKNINLKCRFGIRFAITQMTHLGYRVGDQSAVGHLGEPDEAPCVYSMVSAAFYSHFFSRFYSGFYRCFNRHP